MKPPRTLETNLNLAAFFFIYGTQAIALYMSCELILETLLRFKSWTSLYFWSLIVGACGVSVFTVINIVINTLEPFGSDAMNALTFVATCCVTTGYSMVLYSRLHTIDRDRHSTFLRLLLALIVVSAIGLRIPQIALMAIIDNANVATPRLIMLSDRIWYTDYGFVFSEMLLSSIYIWWFYGYLDDLPHNLKAAFQSVRRQTLAWLVMCFMVNCALGVVQMVIIDKQWRLLGDIYWTTSYAIKLKLEFVVLNQLTKVTEAKRNVLALGNWTPQLAGHIEANGVHRPSTESDACEGPRVLSSSRLKSSPTIKQQTEIHVVGDEDACGKESVMDK